MQATQSVPREDTNAGYRFVLDDDSLVDVLLRDTTRSILNSTMEQAESIERISGAMGLPKSTCYEKVKELLDKGLLVREKMTVTKAGMRQALYRAAARSFRIGIGPRGMEIVILTNERGYNEAGPILEL